MRPNVRLLEYLKLRVIVSQLGQTPALQKPVDLGPQPMHTLIRSGCDSFLFALKRHKILLGVPFLLLSMWILEQILTYTLFLYQAHQLGAELCASAHARAESNVDRDYYIDRLVNPRSALNKTLESWREIKFSHCAYKFIMGDEYGVTTDQLMPAPYSVEIVLLGSANPPWQRLAHLHLRLAVNPLGNLQDILTDKALVKSLNKKRANGATSGKVFLEYWSRLAMLDYEDDDYPNYSEHDNCYTIYPSRNDVSGVNFLKYDSNERIHCLH